MGNWQTEVARMFLYISFPVGVFHYTNYTEDIDDWLTTKREKYLPYNKDDHEKLIQVMQDLNNEKQMKQLKEMEEKHQQMKLKRVAKD